jgi:predicted aminopeptidase
MSRVAHQKMAQQKQSIFAELQQQYQQLKQSWNGYSGYDEWMGQRLNNAHLAMIATYHRRVPEFKQLLAAVDGDLSQFYQQISHQPERETTFKVTTIE